MPRFFFNVHDGVERIDHDGLEFPDADAACGEAVRATGEILRDEDGKVVGRGLVMNVTDDIGRPVLTITVQAEAHNRAP